MCIIGISGHMNSGKSTAAAILVNDHGFTEITFAQAIKDFCLYLFPEDIKHHMLYTQDGKKANFYSKSYNLMSGTWDLGNKKTLSVEDHVLIREAARFFNLYVESVRFLDAETLCETPREVLQTVGDRIRLIFGLEFWIRIATQDLDPENGCYVFSDARYANELAAIERMGGTNVWIGDPQQTEQDSHISERDLSQCCHMQISNPKSEGLSNLAKELKEKFADLLK